MPNDPQFAQQWSLDNNGQTGGVSDADIDAPVAWSVTTGSAATVVALLDSGIDYTHEDLYLNIWINQGEIPAAVRVNLTDVDGDSLITFRDLNDPSNSSQVVDWNGNSRIDAGDLLNSPSWEDGVDTDANGYWDDLVGWDWVNNDNDPMDDNGHGTMVAGMLGAVGNNEVGIAGVNWQVQMMPLRFKFDNVTWTVDAAVSAIDYAVGEDAPISNNSWGNGTGEYIPEIYAAIDRARLAGHLFVAAAGNEQRDADSLPRYPACYDLDNIVSVAATNQADTLASFSNWGNTNVDLAAPGESILSTARGGGYSTGNGTSYATPHVVGVAALLKSLHPQWGAIELKQQIMETVDPLPSLQGKTVTGGRVNAAAALGSPLIDTPLFLDSFENGQWNGLWVQDSQNDWFTSTQRKTDGSYSAEVDGSASDARLTIASPINFTPYGSAELTFDWLIESGLDTGEYVALDLFNGTSWQEVAKLRGNVDAENVWHSPVINIDASYLVSNFQFRFRAKMSGSDEDANVDNVRLIATSLAGPPNQLPIAEDDAATTAEDTAATIDVLANDSDPDLDVLQVESVTQGSHGVVVINGDGTLTYTPQANYFGSDNFTYTISDGRGGTDTASVSVTITSVNDAPVAADDDASTPHDTPAVIDLLANDTDVDSSPLLIQSLGTPLHGTLLNHGDGTVTYTPAPGYIGADSFVYVVTDGSLTDSGTGTIDVQADEVTLVYSNTTSTTIRDRSKTTSTIQVPDAMTILDVNVQLTISHTRDQDLDVYLISPDGARVELFTDVGGNGDHFTGTILDDQASVSITAGAAPFAGTYRPEGTLAALNGRNALGTWTLEITDDQWLYSGTLHSWSITITGGPMTLLADGSSAGPATNAAALDPADAHWAVKQAISWWAPQVNVEPLRNLNVYVSDLPAGYLGLAWGRSLTLDMNANGAGWFVDTASGQGAALSDVFATASRQMDLLTVVAHEVGHLLGYDHSDHAIDVMAATLPAGTRRILGSETPVLPDSWELVVASPLLDRASRLNVAEHKLVDHPSLARAGNDGTRATRADTEAWLLPLAPEDSVIQPGTSGERRTARILTAVADQETELLDDELLELLAASQH